LSNCRGGGSLARLLYNIDFKFQNEAVSVSGGDVSGYRFFVFWESTLDTKIKDVLTELNRHLVEIDSADAYDYFEVIRSYTDELIDANEDESLVHRVFALRDTALYRFEPSNNKQPYATFMVAGSAPPPTPATLTDEQLDFIAAAESFLEDSVLKARVNDILWLRGKEPRHLGNAFELYHKLAKECLDLDSWTSSIDFIRRALFLASVSKRTGRQLFESVVATLTDWVDEYIEDDPRFLSVEALRLLAMYSDMPFDGIVDRVQRGIRSAVDASNWDRAERICLCGIEAAKIHRVSEQRKAFQTKLSEVYVAQSETTDVNSVKSFYLEKAYQTLRGLPDCSDQREELHRQLLETQQLVVDELHIHEHRQEVSDIVTQTLVVVSGQTLITSLHTLLFRLFRIPNYTELEITAAEMAEKYPLSQLFGKYIIADDGRIVAKVPGGAASNGKSFHDHDVYQLAQFDHNAFVSVCILPAIDVIVSEHAPSFEDLRILIANSPFVPRGQEVLWARALHSGFYREFDVAVPILVPLIEGGIRNILQDNGVIVSKLNENGIQELKLLGSLLAVPELKDILGNNLIRDLNGLLLDRTYGNLRNIVAHGIVTERICFSPHAIYLWWLCLWLVLAPRFAAVRGDE
jgi:hypothetical protein